MESGAGHWPTPRLPRWIARTCGRCGGRVWICGFGPVVQPGWRRRIVRAIAYGPCPRSLRRMGMALGFVEWDLSVQRTACGRSVGGTSGSGARNDPADDSARPRCARKPMAGWRTVFSRAGAAERKRVVSGCGQPAGRVLILASRGASLAGLAGSVALGICLDSRRRLDPVALLHVGLDSAGLDHTSLAERGIRIFYFTDGFSSCAGGDPRDSILVQGAG